MMEGIEFHALVTVRQYCQYSLAILFVIACCGVALHAWLSYRLSFFEFQSEKPPESKSKSTFLCILIPCLAVIICSALTPILVIRFNSYMHGIISREDYDSLILFIDFPWKYFLPIKGVDWFAIPICIGTGTIFYFACGFSLLGVWKLTTR